MCNRCEQTRQWYVRRFEREYEDAWAEYTRLSQLFKDVCWYNFETTCRTWQTPWHTSNPDSAISLLGTRQRQWWNKGHLREQLTFPAYYIGRVDNAPPLPPLVLLTDVQDAKRYMDACYEQVMAPYDWAPGGPKYEALRRTTGVGRKRTFSQCHMMESPDEELGSDDDSRSSESFTVTEIKRWLIDCNRLVYECVLDDGSVEIVDRSDLMDGGVQQKLVLRHEKQNPPPWDPCCPHCDGDGCEECECPDCERQCRFLQGVNYGCERHPVI